MIEYENECCSCADETYRCLGSSCPMRKVPHYYCDRCNEETTLYYFFGEHLCLDCIAKEFIMVEGSDIYA